MTDYPLSKEDQDKAAAFAGICGYFYARFL